MHAFCLFLLCRKPSTPLESELFYTWSWWMKALSRSWSFDIEQYAELVLQLTRLLYLVITSPINPFYCYMLYSVCLYKPQINIITVSDIFLLYSKLESLWRKQHHGETYSLRNSMLYCLAFMPKATIWKFWSVWVSIGEQFHTHIDENQTPNHMMVLGVITNDDDDMPPFIFPTWSQIQHRDLHQVPGGGSVTLD